MAEVCASGRSGGCGDVVVAGMFVDVRILDCVVHVIVASATFTKAFAFLRESLVCW